MDFSVLSNVPEYLRPEAEERLTIQQELKRIFQDASRIVVALPGDQQSEDEEVKSQNNGGKTPHYSAFIYNNGNKLRFQGSTSQQLLQQARATQDGK